MTQITQNSRENQRRTSEINKKFEYIEKLNYKQKKLKSGMRVIQKLLILRQVISDLKMYSPVILQHNKNNPTYQEREKYIKDKLQMDKEVTAKY